MHTLSASLNFLNFRDMVNEGLIDKATAIQRLDADGVIQFLAPVFDSSEFQRAIDEGRSIGSGLPAGPGAACGVVVFDSTRAAERAKHGVPVILVRYETSPEDIGGMSAANGILTVRGGMTSHAALVARQMGKVAVVGAEGLRVDYAARTLTAAGSTALLREGDWLALDGTRGIVVAGQVKTSDSDVMRVMRGEMAPADSPTYELFRDVLAWTEEFRTLDVRMNADSAAQAAEGVFFGAQGIGLTRT